MTQYETSDLTYVCPSPDKTHRHVCYFSVRLILDLGFPVGNTVETNNNWPYISNGTSRLRGQHAARWKRVTVYCRRHREGTHYPRLPGETPPIILIGPCRYKLVADVWNNSRYTKVASDQWFPYSFNRK